MPDLELTVEQASVSRITGGCGEESGIRLAPMGILYVGVLLGDSLRGACPAPKK